MTSSQIRQGYIERGLDLGEQFGVLGSLNRKLINSFYFHKSQ